MPYGTPGPIVINEGQNTDRRSDPTAVLPAPEAQKIFFTTHPSKACLNSINGRQSPQDYCNPQFEIPKVKHDGGPGGKQGSGSGSGGRHGGNVCGIAKHGAEGGGRILQEHRGLVGKE
ncbi:hypothetical protein ACI65C_002402 [Semiaphis heraclei]